MKAFILSAGFGSRMGSLTKEKPKCLIEINGETLLERHLKNLRSAGIDEVIINLHHKAEAVKEYLRENNNFDLEISISKESEIMGTGGALLHAKDLIGSDPFLLISGDIFTNYPFSKLIKKDWNLNFSWKNDDSPVEGLAYLVGISHLYPTSDQDKDFGWLHLNLVNSRSRFISPEEGGYTYAGIAVINPTLLEKAFRSREDYKEKIFPIQLWSDFLYDAAITQRVVGESYIDEFDIHDIRQDGGIHVNINTQEDIKTVEFILNSDGKTK